MKKKIIGIFVCMLLIATAVLPKVPDVSAEETGGSGEQDVRVFNLTDQNVLQSNDVKDVFIYDVTKDDIDYTTWYNDSSLSWWQEINKSKFPVLWNKLGSDSEVQDSEIGSNGTVVGNPTYAVGKFGNGLNATTSDYVTFPNTLYNVGTFEAWVRLDVAIGSLSGFEIVFSSTKDGYAYDGAGLWLSPISGGLLGAWIYPTNIGFSTSISWNAGEMKHIAMVWNSSGIDGSSNTLRVYIDGVLFDSDNRTFNVVDPKSVIDVGYDGGCVDFEGVIDNFKVYDYAKTNFEDRLIENSTVRSTHFPTKSYLITTDLGLDIVDAQSRELWMRFEGGTGNALPDVVMNSVIACDGIVHVGTDDGLFMINFTDDEIIMMDSAGSASYNGNISTRNDGDGYDSTSGMGIVDDAVNDIALTSDHAFIGTDGGVSLINLSSGLVFDDSGDVCFAVDITDEEELIYHDNDELLRKDSLQNTDWENDVSTYINGINAIASGGEELFVGVKGGGVVRINSSTFNVTHQIVRSSFNDSEPLCWNKMETVSGTTFVSEIGPNLTRSSTNYDLEDSMFGKGFDNNAESTFLYGESDEMFASGQKGAAEFYWVPDDDSDTIVGTGPPTGYHLKQSYFISNVATTSSINDRWYFQFHYRHYISSGAIQPNPAFNGFFGKRDQYGNWNICEIWKMSNPRIDLPGNWSAGDRVHISIAWHNESVILGKYILAIWINGELLYGFTEPTIGTYEGWRTTNPLNAISPNIRIGDSIYSYSGDEQLRGPMDNVKTYGFAKEDWGDRHLENGSVTKSFSGETGNVRALALADDDTTLYVGTNDGNDGGGISKIDTMTSALLSNWTSGNNEALVDYDINSLSFWQHPDIVNVWELLVGTENGASVIFAEKPPETTKTIGDPKYGDNDEWVTSATEFNLTATDDISGVGVIYYRTWYNNVWNPEPGTGVGINNNFMEYSGNFTLSSEGKHYIEYYSLDNAGNVEGVHNQTHYVDDPVEMINDVIEDIEDMGLHYGIENSLTQKLNNVTQSLDNGQTNAAINQLNAFINQVEAQRGKKLTDEQADALVNVAQQIIDYINNL